MLTWNSVSAAAPFTTYTSWANTFGPLAWMFSTNPERSEASPRGARGMCWEWYTASAPAEVGRARTAIAIKAPAASGDRCMKTSFRYLAMGAVGWITTRSSGPQASKLLSDWVQRSRRRVDGLRSSASGTSRTPSGSSRSRNAAELRLGKPHVDRLEARPPNVEGRRPRAATLRKGKSQWQYASTAT